MYTVCMSSTFHDATLATVTVFLYRIYNKITNKQELPVKSQNLIYAQ